MKLQFFVDKTSVKTKQKRRLLERRAKRGCVRNFAGDREGHAPFSPALRVFLAVSMQLL